MMSFSKSRPQAAKSLLLWMLLLAGLLLLPLQAAVKAQGLRGSDSVVKPSLVWSTTQARPGGQAVAAIVIDIDDHFHINPNAQQIPKDLDFLIPLTVELGGLPQGVTVGQPQFPQAVELKFGAPGNTIPGYEKRAVIYLPVAIDPGYAGQSVTFKVNVGYQSCNDTTCLRPSETTLEATIPVAGAGAAVDAGQTLPADVADIFKDFDPAAHAAIASAPQSQAVQFDFFNVKWSYDAATVFGLVMIIIMALSGGLLLNFTPCVLPVIPIKILSLKQAAGGRGKQVRLGIAMSLGVIAFWVGLGIAMAISAHLASAAVAAASDSAAAGNAGGAFSSTNQLFQFPWFNIGVGAVIVVMAVGMCGLFAIRLPQWVYRINPGHDSYHGSFGFGVMTAVLSTPCTAPFMGAAASWAVTQSAAITMMVFFAIGFGMSLPYLILSANPAWIDKMPRTGPGSELIKQVMGLLLLAAGVFFIGTGLSGLLVDPPQPPSRVYWWAVAAMVALAGLWLMWRTVRIAKSNVAKGVFVPVGALLVVAAIWGGWTFTDHGPIKWTYYTPEILAKAKADDKVIVLEFTAEWCLNCKTLEQTVLATDAVADVLNGSDVRAIKVDLTGNNTLGNQLLKEMDRVAIPLLVVMSPDGRQVFKSDYYTVQLVLDAVEAAKGQKLATLR